MAGDDDEKCSNNNLTTQFEREAVSRVTFECRISPLDEHCSNENKRLFVIEAEIW